jgi:hypothetical protein
MHASIGRLIDQARAFLEDPDYGWISPALLQRRLRVTAKMSRYLCDEVNGAKDAPHWSRDPPPSHR